MLTPRARDRSLACSSSCFALHVIDTFNSQQFNRWIAPDRVLLFEQDIYTYIYIWPSCWQPAFVHIWHAIAFHIAVNWTAHLCSSLFYVREHVICRVDFHFDSAHIFLLYKINGKMIQPKHKLRDKMEIRKEDKKTTLH